MADTLVEDELDSKTMREVVLKVREIQKRRYGTPAKLNAKLSSREVKKYCKPESKAESFLESVAEKFGFSARSIHKVLKIARTIADIEECEIILKKHIAEAVQYRVLEKTLWEE